MQTLREIFEENIIQKIHSTRKISIKFVNTFLASIDSYNNSNYTDLLPVFANKFIVLYYKEMLEKMFNAPFTVPSLSLPFSKQEISSALEKRGIKQPYIVFVPFTSDSKRRNWPFERFVMLTKKLEGKTNLKIIVLGTCPKNIKHYKFGKNIINLLNKTNLLEAMKIAAGAKYSISSDTSLMHCSLIGGAETITLSCGITKNLFVVYPSNYNVKQKVFFPTTVNEQGIGKMEDISFDSVWEHIQEQWLKA